MTGVRLRTDGGCLLAHRPRGTFGSVRHPWLDTAYGTYGTYGTYGFYGLIGAADHRER